MPNEVYRETRERLAGLVSARAAKRVLDDAMRRRGYSSDSISSHQMKGMLMGPVLADLEAILPRAGLQRNLREVGRALDALHAPTEPPRPSAAPAAPITPITPSRGASRGTVAPTFELETDDDRPRRRPAGFVPAPELPRPGERPTAVAVELGDIEADEVELDLSPLVDETAAPDVSGPTSVGKLVAELPAPPPAPPLADPLPAESLRGAVLRFAKIESVQQVAALRADGSVVETRGRAVDLESLGLLIASSLGLLRRHGPIRSYYLQHTQGQLFLFPVGQDTLIVVGRTNLNLGAVFTALAALEEEL